MNRTTINCGKFWLTVSRHAKERLFKRRELYKGLKLDLVGAARHVFETDCYEYKFGRGKLIFKWNENGMSLVTYTPERKYA